jgi:hypothetical protein
MPVEIQRLTSDVDVVSDAPVLSDAMVERIAARVEERLRRRERAQEQRAAATGLRSGATPAAWRGGGHDRP